MRGWMGWVGGWVGGWVREVTVCIGSGNRGCQGSISMSKLPTGGYIRSLLLLFLLLLFLLLLLLLLCLFLHLLVFASRRRAGPVGGWVVGWVGG